MNSDTLQLRVLPRSELAKRFDLRHLSQKGHFIKIVGPCPEYDDLVALVNQSKVVTLRKDLGIEEQLAAGDVLLGINTGWYENPGESEKTKGFYTDLYVNADNQHLTAFEQMATMTEALTEQLPPPVGSVKDAVCWVIYMADNQLRLTHNTWYQQ